MVPLRPPSPSSQPPDTVFLFHLRLVSCRKNDVAAAGAVAWQMPPGRGSAATDLSCRLRGPDIGVQSQLAIRHGWLVTRHRRLSPRAQRTRCSWEDCLGLRGCPTPLLRPGHPGHRHIAPPQNRASFVCRFPHQNPAPPLHGFTARKRGRGHSPAMTAICACGDGWLIVTPVARTRSAVLCAFDLGALLRLER